MEGSYHRRGAWRHWDFADAYSTCVDTPSLVSLLMTSAAFSARATTAALMLPDGTDGITEASMTLKPCTPFTFRFSSTTPPMLQVEVGWNTVSPISRQYASQSSSVLTFAPGMNSSVT